MKLYTRTGDDGTTGLFGGGRVSKASIRVSAYGDVDELNSALGIMLQYDPWPELKVLLQRIQSDLFDVGANLATPPGSEFAASLKQISDIAITELESEIDRAQAAAPELKNFILPGGSRLAAWAFFVRTVCRRAERNCVLLADDEPVAENVVTYLNRLSDLLFAVGREANARAGLEETPWVSRDE